jgi:hypothetical protein
MGFSLQLTLAKRPLRVVAILVFGALLAPASATARIIIDDFVDPIEIEVPEQNTDRILTDNVGELSAFRAVSINGLLPIPVGSLDIDITHPSALTAEISALTQNPSNPILTINIGYTFTTIPFDGVDLTQSGVNDALILEFDQLSAAVPLRGLRTSVTYGPTSAHYISTLAPMPESTDPFTLVFPFDEFRVARGSPANEFVFSNARELGVVVELARINPLLPDQLNFDMVLTEVRLARVTPEIPTVVGFVFLGAIVVLRIRGPRDKECHHGEISCRNRPANNGALPCKLPAVWPNVFCRQ